MKREEAVCTWSTELGACFSALLLLPSCPVPRMSRNEIIFFMLQAEQEICWLPRQKHVSSSLPRASNHAHAVSSPVPFSKQERCVPSYPPPTFPFSSFAFSFLPLFCPSLYEKSQPSFTPFHAMLFYVMHGWEEENSKRGRTGVKEESVTRPKHKARHRHARHRGWRQAES